MNTNPSQRTTFGDHERKEENNCMIATTTEHNTHQVILQLQDSGINHLRNLTEYKVT